jgi:hypothetical protein
VVNSIDFESLAEDDTNNNPKLNRPVDEITRKTCPFKTPPPNKGNLRKNSRCGGIMTSNSLIPEELNGEFSIVHRFTWEGNIGNNLCFESSLTVMKDGKENSGHVFETESYEVNLIRYRSEVGVERISKRSMDLRTDCHSFINFQCYKYIQDEKAKYMSHVKQFDEYYPGIDCGFCLTTSTSNKYVTLLKLNHDTDDFLEMRMKVTDYATGKEAISDVLSQPVRAISATESFGEKGKFTIELVKSGFKNPVAGMDVMHTNDYKDRLWSPAGMNTAGGEIDKRKCFWALHDVDREYNERNVETFKSGAPSYHSSTNDCYNHLPELSAFTRVNTTDLKKISFYKEDPFHGDTITITGTLRTKITKVYRVSGQIADFSCILRPSEKDVQWFECKVEAVAQPGATMMYLYEPNSCNALAFTMVLAEIGKAFQVNNKVNVENEALVKICTEYGVCKDFISKRETSRPDQIHTFAAKPHITSSFIEFNFIGDLFNRTSELLRNAFGESFTNWYNWFLIVILSIVGISILIMVFKCYLSGRSSAAVIKIEQELFRKVKETEKED